MQVFPPVRLNQVVALKHALYHKVILLVALVKQALLYYRKLAL